MLEDHYRAYLPNNQKREVCSEKLERDRKRNEKKECVFG